MFSKDLKQLLDEKYLEYNKSEFFIETDPIQIPKCFEEKEDIEIAGFLAASLAWGHAAHDYQEMQRVDAINGLCTP
ncbi:DUF2400 family protein [Butyricimonas virosa]|uniref:DUF2400 family protein n=1 Tax=Butyricimonas virosa TaxID=544645 RepID=UPI0032BF87B1